MNAKDIPLNESRKVDTIKEILDIAEKEAGDKIAFKYKIKNNVKEVTYKEFQNDTIYLGTALSTIQMGDKHIATIGNNSYEWITTYLTVLKSNGVFVPIDKELTCAEIINVLKNSDSEILFYAEPYEKYIEEFKKQLPNVKYYIGFDRAENEGNLLSYKKFIKEGKNVYFVSFLLLPYFYRLHFK